MVLKLVLELVFEMPLAAGNKKEHLRTAILRLQILALKKVCDLSPDKVLLELLFKLFTPGFW